MITVVGGGLAGSLLALELAARHRPITLVEAGGEESATALSYGLLLPGALGIWRALVRRHQLEGLRRRWLQLGTRGLPLPGAQVDPGLLRPSLQRALERAGVQLRGEHLRELPEPGPVVLACGAGCRALAPSLDARLGVSWAGLLELEARAVNAAIGWPPGLARLPGRFARLDLEQRAPQLNREEWVVDPGLVPCGDRLLAGQISLIRPGMEAGLPPDPAVMEQRLRQALAGRWPRIADAPGRYRQAPVSFCSDGVPLAGPVGPGLMVLAGFSAAFSQLPAAAACLAEQLAADSRP
ncbi:MAG: FAD-dependent oxidoreductase [Synechococcus sp. ELA057]